MELIEYIGINSNEDMNLENFRQFNTSLSVYIPDDRESINEITKVWVKTEIMDSHIVETPVGTSFEGQILTGNKLLIMANILVKIEYTSCDVNGFVNTIQLDIPISSYVSIEEDFDDYLTAYPSFNVDDIYCKKLNDREFYLNIDLLSITDIF
ncbi:MAG: hypothetical protein R3Y64_00215 [Peptostreptococcaceae bacterium]